MKLDTRLVAALIALPLIGASVIVIGNNTGTAAERCDRFWQSAASSAECNQALSDAEMDRLQVQADRSAEAVEQSQRRLRDIDRAIRDLQSRQ